MAHPPYRSQVQPITLLKSDFKLAHTQQVAVSNTFICYGLKAGHIRALNRNTADRALFKGHPTAVSHMAFFGPSTPLLASASCKGDLTVRQIAAAPGEGGAEGTITGDVLLHAQLPLPAGAEAAPDGARVTLAWHPVMSQILAAAAGGSVLIYEVPTTAPGGDAQPAPASPGIRYGIAGGASVSSVAFSPTGDLLAAGDSAGGVRVWWMEGDEDTADAPALAWQPFGGSGSIGSVHFLHQAGDGSSLLLTGDATNSSLKLWALPSAAAATAAGDGQQPQCLQSVSFVGSKGGAASPFFCHVAVQPELQVVVLANTARKQVYTLHYSLGADGDMGGAAFDYAAFFSVKQPILSLVALLEAAEASGAGAAAQQQAAAAQQGQQLMLYCVQTEAIQQYTINPALCMAGSAEEEAAEEVGSSSEAAPAPPAADAAASSSSAAAAAAPEPLASNSPAPAAAVPPPAKLPTPTFLGSRAKAAQKAAAAAASPDKGALPAAASRAAKAAAVADNNKKQQAQAEVAPSPESVACDESDSTAAVQAAVDSVEDVAAAAAASPLPPLPTTSLMHSAEKVPAPAAAGADGAAATAARAALAAVAGGAVAAAAGTAAGGSDAAVLQQQMQQLLAMQQQMAGQLHAATQQTVAGALCVGCDGAWLLRSLCCRRAVEYSPTLLCCHLALVLCCCRCQG
jgi:enhancer of mRNA-decapping protein 4